MKITVGHTPDSDDAFMFYGMLEGHTASPDFEVSHVIDDIESLNQRAKTGSLDVTAVSAHACAYIPNYTVLRSGGSFGIGYGPIVVSRGDILPDQLPSKRIAVPGTMTSAFLLLQLMIGKFEYTVVSFEDIPRAVSDGTVDAGLVIHETQLSYDIDGLQKVSDIGRWWTEVSGGLPVPLGINVMRTDHGSEVISRFDRYLRESILYGMRHFEDALDYSMRYGRGRPRSLISQFVRMYVNDITADMGQAGVSSMQKMFELAGKQGLVPDFELRVAPKIQ